MSHTPGPWTIEDRSFLNGCDILAPVEDWSDKPTRIAHVVPFANYMDTSRLIAAAPTMLTVLKLAERAMRLGDNNWYAEMPEYKAVVEVIAEVEGREK